jgi:uncharacterized protein
MTLRALVVCLLTLSCASGQDFKYSASVLEDDGQLARAMPGIADKAIAMSRSGDPAAELDNLFRLQLVAGRYSDALATMLRIRDGQNAGSTAHPGAANAQFEIYALAKVRQAAEKLNFDDALRQAFREVLRGLDDVAAADVVSAFGRSLAQMQEDFNKAVLDRRNGKNTIDASAALDLARKYLLVQAYQSFQPLIADLIAEDDHRRYFVDDGIAIRTADGMILSAIVVRPRSGEPRLTTLMTFTIYAAHFNFGEARRTAAHGYAAVVAYTRGKGLGTGAIAPYEHDGEDAAAVIGWISGQGWSDGRVGMYGGSYSGFTTWAAAKRMPPALKAIMAAVPVVPGFDVPMEGNVFLSFVYPWPLYAATGPWLDDAQYGDKERWARLFRIWYETGQAYRSLDRIDGTPNPVFRRWLDHPAYDAYWQAMVPSGPDYARIDIPVLQTAGYLQGQSLTAPYYFSEHYKYNPRAEHYLVLGPYNHFGAQRRPQAVVGGYSIDPVARIDIEDLRYQWFDYALKGRVKPALLGDKVNYEVMGANEWKHAPTIAGMSNGSLRLFLTPTRIGSTYALSLSKWLGKGAITQKVALADRRDADRVIPDGTVDRLLDSANSVVFVGKPITEPMEIAGQFSGELAFITNKKDLDINVVLYELLPSGEYFALSYYLVRASFANDPGHRRLLAPGNRERLAFRTGHVTSRSIVAGSRLVVVLGTVKQPDLQINYGSGKDVSDETIDDAKVPQQVTWFPDSYLDIPVWRK